MAQFHTRSGIIYIWYTLTAMHLEQKQVLDKTRSRWTGVLYLQVTWAGIKIRWASILLTHPLKLLSCLPMGTCKHAVLGPVWCSLRAVRSLHTPLNTWIPKDNKSLASLQRPLMQCKSVPWPSKMRSTLWCLPKKVNILEFISSFSCFTATPSAANRPNISRAIDSRKWRSWYTDSPCMTRRRAWVVVASPTRARASKMACLEWWAQLNATSLDNKPGCKSACNLAKIASCSSNILIQSPSRGGFFRAVWTYLSITVLTRATWDLEESSDTQAHWRKSLSLSDSSWHWVRSLAHMSTSTMEVALAALQMAKSTAGPCMSLLIRNGCHDKEWSTLRLSRDSSPLLTPTQNRFLKGKGRAHTANVIECVFRATVCACNARCDVTPDMPDRMNCIEMVNMKTQWRRWAMAFPSPLGVANGKRPRW